MYFCFSKLFILYLLLLFVHINISPFIIVHFSFSLPTESKMNVGVAHSEVNPNTRVMNSRGIWLTYALGVGMLHIVLLSIPFFSVPVVWTLTNVIHNFVSVPCSIIHLVFQVCLSVAFLSSASLVVYALLFCKDSLEKRIKVSCMTSLTKLKLFGTWWCVMKMSAVQW